MHNDIIYIYIYTHCIHIKVNVVPFLYVTFNVNCHIHPFGDGVYWVALLS